MSISPRWYQSILGIGEQRLASYSAVVTISCLLFVMGCTSPHNEADMNVLTFGVSRVAVKLDPRFATDAASSRVNRLIYDQLTDFDCSYKTVPALAEWEQRDPNTYHIQLNSTRTFHHGKPLTAEDVVATFNSILDESTGSPHRGTLKVISSVVALSASTVEFTLTQPDPLFPSYLSIGILPADLLAADHDFVADPVGSGVFRFVERQGDQSLLIKRDIDDFQVRFEKVSDPSVRAIKLVKGEIDLLQNDLLPELEIYLRDQPGIETKNAPGTNYSYIGFNMEDPLTSNASIRRAIAFAIDRESLIEYLLQGSEQLANGIFPPTHWVGLSDDPIEYNPGLSKMLLKQLGYSKENPLEISYKTSTDPLRVRIATFIQQQLADVGIKVNLETYDWGTFYGDIKAGKFQMYSLIWVGIKSPDFYRYVFHSDFMPPEGANRGRYHNDKVNAALDKADEMLNLADRITFYHAAQRLVNDQLPYISLWYEDNFAAYRERISGYQINADGNYDSLLSTHLQSQPAPASDTWHGCTGAPL